MSPSSSRLSARARVVLGAAVIVVVAGLLGARLLARPSQRVAIEPPTGEVAEPAALRPAELEVPCWSCPSAKTWPVRFRTDLDLLAPLGDGPANAAEWFAAFEKERGPRAGEAAAMMERRTLHDSDLGMVVAPDDPLLLEAEPWVDQSTMRFYPDVFPMEGVATRITNLLAAITFARSWTARGVDAADPDRGLEDCRRAIRLGRLLRQEDAVIISDLVGLACIHIGTRGVYRIAQREGDLGLALLASVVLGEIAPQRALTAERISAFDLAPYLHRDDAGLYRLELPDRWLDQALETAATLTERRFFGEAILSGNVVLHLGTPEQQDRVRGWLEGLAADDDAIVADFAQWALDHPPADDELAELYPHPVLTR